MSLAEDINDLLSEASPGTIRSQSQKHLDQINQGLGSSDDRGTASGIAGMLAMLATVASDMSGSYHGLTQAERKPWKKLAHQLWGLNKQAITLSQRPRRTGRFAEGEGLGDAIQQELGEAFDPNEDGGRTLGGIVELGNELNRLANSKAKDADRKILAVLRKLKKRINALDL